MRPLPSVIAFLLFTSSLLIFFFVQFSVQDYTLCCYPFEYSHKRYCPQVDSQIYYKSNYSEVYTMFAQRDVTHQRARYDVYDYFKNGQQRDSYTTVVFRSQVDKMAYVFTNTSSSCTCYKFNPTGPVVSEHCVEVYDDSVVNKTQLGGIPMTRVMNNDKYVESNLLEEYHVYATDTGLGDHTCWVFLETFFITSTSSDDTTRFSAIQSYYDQSPKVDPNAFGVDVKCPPPEKCDLIQENSAVLLELKKLEHGHVYRERSRKRN
ncbi:hypothetical protein C9374_000021 [Naegleria lovaniensis]|uniref:Uncharacterized protein n=1 Tax=Naegleria lovaniensis TaxID=51637 RepID=A0AA88GTG6_NAELO|nr:uncharacterized protein C9374_000021 [Naegleria lovaniensis]KAG2388582.1 hypothetical protein C9374_000021 [Naegleria lovaniensis]